HFAHAHIVGEVATGSTPVGTIADVEGAISIPANTTSGSYFLILVADDGKVIAEEDESNNFLSGNIFVNAIGECAAPVINTATIACETESVALLKVEWDEVPGATAYQFSLVNKTTGDLIIETQLDENTYAGNSFNFYSSTSFEFNTAYEAQVAAVCADGISDFTKVEFTTTAPTYDFSSYFQNFVQVVTAENPPFLRADLLLRNGGLASAEIDIDLYISTDDQLSDDDILWRTSSGGTSVCNVERSFFGAPASGPLPDDLEDGDYFLLAEVDPDNAFAEFDESNNVSSVPFTLMRNAGPTVQVTTPSLTVDGPFQVSVAFSESVTDFTLAEILVMNGTKSNPTQQSGSMYSFTVTPTEPGEVTVLVLANSAFNGDGDGNLQSNLLQVQFGDDPQPDLTGSFTRIPGNVSPGEIFDIQYEVINDSEAVAGPSTMRLYQHREPDFNLNTASLVQERSFNEFAPGARRVINTVSSVSEEGRWYLTLLIDADDAVGESNENNNQFLATFTAGSGNGGVDIALSMTTSTPDPKQYDFFSAELTIVNEGSATATGVRVFWREGMDGFVARGGMEASATAGLVRP
ncbi:MAG: CARDB domain-containing protein, partial [Bacteroidota bacterium]